MVVIALKNQEYELRFMRWKVSKTFSRNGEEWALLKGKGKRKFHFWEVPLSFLEIVSHRRVS